MANAAAETTTSTSPPSSRRPPGPSAWGGRLSAGILAAVFVIDGSRPRGLQAAVQQLSAVWCLTRHERLVVLRAAEQAADGETRRGLAGRRGGRGRRLAGGRIDGRHVALRLAGR